MAGMRSRCPPVVSLCIAPAEPAAERRSTGTRATVRGRAGRPWKRGNTVRSSCHQTTDICVVVSGTGDDRDLWLKDFTTGVFSRLTLAPGAEVNPVWSPDSRRVAYVGSQNPRDTLFETAVGSGKYTADPRWSVRAFSRIGPTMASTWSTRAGRKVSFSRSLSLGVPRKATTSPRRSSTSRSGRSSPRVARWQVGRVHVVRIWPATRSLRRGVSVVHRQASNLERQRPRCRPGAVAQRWPGVVLFGTRPETDGARCRVRSNLADGTGPGVVRIGRQLELASSHVCRHARRQDGSWSASRLEASRPRSSRSTS